MLPRCALLLAVLVAVASASFCSNNKSETLKVRYVSRRGIVLNMTLHWASDPARAASALFAVILRQVLGYQRVYLRQSPHLDLRSFAATVPHNATRRYDEAILALSTSWEPDLGESRPKWAPNQGAVCGLAGPRLEEFGASSIPVRQRLHVYVNEYYRNQSQCQNENHWNFYTNATVLEQCGFHDNASRAKPQKKAVVYQLDSNIAITEVKKFAETLDFEIMNVSRKNLFEMLRTGNQSFLFVDYDIWAEHKRVKTIPQPFCLPTMTKSLLEPSTAVPMRVGDVAILTENAPALIQLAYNFIITAETIREILELESDGKDVEQAAEEWANKTKEYSHLYEPSLKDYDVLIFYCKDDPDFENYDDLIRWLSQNIIVDVYSTMFKIRPMRYSVDCDNYVRSKINHFTSLGIKQRGIGAIVGSMNNITHVAKTADGFNVPVLYYDAMGIDADSTKSTWLTTGRSLHIVLALRYFFRDHNWTRVAVLSEPTDTAKRFVEDLKLVGDIALRDHPIRHGLSKSEAKDILSILKNGHENARIILVNTNYNDAATILAAAASVGMNSTKDYAWIVREWRPNHKTVDIKHFTFSFWCRCGNDPSQYVGFPEVRKEMDKLYTDCTWPPHAATLVDALFTLINGFKSSILKCPQLRDDLRNEEAIEIFETSVIEERTQGLTQNLSFKGRTLEETVVFVDEWQGRRHSHLGRWRVNAATGKVVIEHQQRSAYSPGEQPHDGSSKCFASSGDAYLPTCHDWEWGTMLIFIMLMPPALLMIYRTLRRRLRDHEKKIICEVLAQRQRRVAAFTANYLVDRSALSLRHELGSGRYGYVRLAWLRIPGNAPQFVAAKALRDHENENEVLHEACVLASLYHENIIRLVGVCIDKDPPLILMEVAFFGDLHQYLRDRRYLVEGADFGLTQRDKCDEEAAHVSAEALTRLARQAASALGYLALRGVIHRDLRASNCLVDAKRTLKLADFGLAREVKACSEGDMEYASQRRGLFPVLWMAPESLARGVFSPASDIWAFGVLMFELVTLGARPFGDMSPELVMQFVRSGGKPSMPRDATPQTIALARLCWHREAEQRPTAANVVAYLAERPYALRPAFDGDDEQPIDADSGCGESPMSELLPKLQINIPVAPKPDSRIILYWGSDPSRVAAGLFATVIQDALGYDRVTVRNGSHRLSDLIVHAKLLPYPNDWRKLRQIALILSTVWEPAPVTTQTRLNDGAKYSLAGPRLQEFGTSEVPSRLQLHVYLPKEYLAKCVNFIREWSWYTDSSALPSCGFGNYTISGEYLTVYVLNPKETSASELQSVNDQIYLPKLRFSPLIDRKSLLQMLHTDSQSFLFIDYDLWIDYPNIYTINLPSCVPRKGYKGLTSPNTVTLRIADVPLLKLYAPRLLRLAYIFKPSLKTIREILEKESDLPPDKSTRRTLEEKKSNYIRQAACVWASNNSNIIDKWVQKYYEQTYEIAIFHCADDPDLKEYHKLLNIFTDDLNQTRNKYLSMKLTLYDANCSDTNYLNHMLVTQLTTELVGQLMGVVIGGLKGITTEFKAFSWANFPIILYQDNSLNENLPGVIWKSARPPFSMAIALHHFIRKMNWTRVAVISENTFTAEEFVDHLINLRDIVLHNYIISRHITQQSADDLLKELQIAKARIVLVNTNAEDAVAILSAAKDLRMDASNDYAWIVRERLPDNQTLGIKHFTISFFCHSGKDLPHIEGRPDLRDKMDELWSNRTWPEHAAPLIDAVLTLLSGFKSIMFKYPQLWNDVRDNTFIRLMETSFTEKPIKGIFQNLTYKERSLEENLVFIEEWPDHQFKYKARWRINTTAKAVLVDYEQNTPYYGRSPPHDGSSKCLVNTGDPYQPTCHDNIWKAALVTLLLTAIILGLVRYIQRYRSQKKNNNIQLSNLYKDKFASLSENCKVYLVKRSALEIAEKVKKGQFSCLALAILHVEGKIQTVNMKSVCRHQMDSGILREASILMSLKHEHIISLVGVCMENEPPLVMLEVTFFGDLLQYLQSRRYLLKDVAPEVDIGEAVYISARALTELARQAASALDYLSTRGVIHRDLRASNCLINANRYLKLAGFCMATSKDSEIEESCMKPGLLPAQRMAPETLHGEFSAASDIWSFGALVFELVTLGAIPYGDLSASLIIKFVSVSGTPRMPADASSLTNELVEMCWRQDPKQRVTAAEVVTYLTREPTALSPTIEYEEDRL